MCYHVAHGDDRGPGASPERKQVPEARQSGETIEVTDRGRPVARLVPIVPTGLDRLVAEGRIRLGNGRWRDLPPPIPLPPGMTPPSELVSRMRDE